VFMMNEDAITIEEIGKQGSSSKYICECNEGLFKMSQVRPATLALAARMLAPSYAAVHACSDSANDCGAATLLRSRVHVVRCRATLYLSTVLVSPCYSTLRTRLHA
jgi:hypothetical protein